MHVALDAQLIATDAGYRSAGVSAYSLNLLRALGRMRSTGATRHLFTAYVNARGFRTPGIDVVTSDLPLQRPLARILWEQTAFPIASVYADVAHGLVNVLPLARSGPGVVTVHDLAFVHAPETMPVLRRAYLTALCRASVARASRVIAVSTQTADDLMRTFGTPASRIVVVPNGVGAEFSPGTPGRAARYRGARGLPERFFLFVGTLEPRKNLVTLVRAWARWRAQSDASTADIKLVIAGGRGWYYQTLFDAVRALGQEQSILFPGFVSGDDLPDLYRSALALVYPSRLEGFGLPVLEAMASGLPAVISDTPSLAEVAGDAAIRVAPEDESALADALALLASQPALRDELSARGLDRSAGYSWRRTATETIEVYEQANR